MFKKVLFLFLFSISWVTAAPQPLKMSDVHPIMERFFSFHIESKEFTPVVLRRSIKLYIENFDPEKCYLLQEEISPYLNMSDATAKQMVQRLKNNDYSDFLRLNEMFSHSVARAKAARGPIVQALVYRNDFVTPSSTTPASYAETLKDLRQRQQDRMVRFYLFHKTRTQLDTLARRARVYELFEKRVARHENNYSFQSSQGETLDAASKENVMALRMLKSFARSLDTHTSFFSPEEAYEMRMVLEKQKQFEGVGVVLSESIDGVMIAELIKGSPAEMSGKIKVNDLLVEIDGVATNGASFEEVLEILKKRDKGELTLGFKRVGAKTSTVFRVPLLKKAIVVNEERLLTSYVETADGIIGKITLFSFYENSDGVSSEKDIKDAIRSFREKGKLVGLVLDLRENSGGFLSQAVKVAGLFISNGVVAIAKYGKEIHYLRNITPKSYYNGPLVVLTSKMSASASEIVAQALQDYGVALVVGDVRTFGKGSIQYQTVTDAKADVFFKVTVGKYYTPSGRSTQISGVAADIVVPSHYAAYNIGEQHLEYPLSSDKVEPAFVDPLTDLDDKTQKLFRMRYQPFAQKIVTYWKKMTPELSQNSARRLNANPKFQVFLKKQDEIRARASTLTPNTVDEASPLGNLDIQMDEAVEIVKDMIRLEASDHNRLAS